MVVQIGLGGAYGRIGETIRTIAPDYEDIAIALTFDPNGGDHTRITDYPGDDLDEQIDIYLDFTTEETVVENVETAASYGIDSVVGTTGWESQQQRMDEIPEEYGINILSAANFSYGANTFFDTVETAAKRLGEGWDAGIAETHHVHKTDAPSGTALQLFDILEEYLWDSPRAVEDKVGSTRVGEIPGEHRVRFTNEETGEELVYTHAASGTEDFARGALTAVQEVDGSDLEPDHYGFREDFFAQ